MRVAQDLQRELRSLGPPRARADDDAIGTQRAHLVQIRAVPPADFHPDTELGEALHQVEGEGVAVVDDQQHGGNLSFVPRQGKELADCDLSASA